MNGIHFSHQDLQITRACFDADFYRQRELALRFVDVNKCASDAFQISTQLPRVHVG